MTSGSHNAKPGRGHNEGRTIEFARLVERGLREDLQRLHADLLEEESRLTALEEIRWHSMKDFEALSEEGVTTAEAALYYTLFHHLTQEINLQGRLVVNAQRRVRDKQAAVQAASDDLRAAQRRTERGADQTRSTVRSPNLPWDPARPGLKKAS